MPVGGSGFDGFLERAVAGTGLPGVSAVVTRGGAVVHAGGYGRESTGDAVSARTPMRVASLTKAFTAMAVLILVEDGVLELDRPVAEQVPEFRTADPRSAGITVRHLLNQTSGLADRTMDVRAAEATDSLAAYVATLRTARLAAEPGTRWAYSNVNYNLAARVVEVASGREFGDFLAERIFTPLGMTDSRLGDEIDPPAAGFNSLFGWWIVRDEIPGFLATSGSGGLITTAADLGRWLITQSGDSPQLVGAESLALMHAPSPVNDYGMGWGREDTLITHSGNLFTYTAATALDPTTGYGYAVLTNGAALHDDTYEILTGLVALGRGETPAIPGGGRQWTEGVLAAFALAALALGLTGVLRARRWAERRASTRWWWITLRCTPTVTPILLFAAYPQAISLLMNGRTVTWTQLTYFPAPLSLTLLTCALAATATLTTRLTHLHSLGSPR